MPPVVVIPAPECGGEKHRHPPAQDASVKDVVFAPLGPNYFSTLNLLRRKYGRLE